METLFQCKNCGKENNIFDINGTCGNCNNNKLENFRIIITRGKLRGMSGMHTLSTAKEILKSALNKEKILLVDPKKHLFEDGEKVRIKDTGEEVTVGHWWYADNLGWEVQYNIVEHPVCNPFIFCPNILDLKDTQNNSLFVGRPGKGKKTHIIKESNFKPELAPKEANIERIQIDSNSLVVMSY